VQRRTYSKKGSIELNPLLFTALNPKFVGYRGFAASISYHARENLSVELLSSIYTDAFYSDLVHDVYEYEQLTPEEVDLKKMTYFGTLGLQFSALYGKLEFYGYLMDYDFYVNTGLGLVYTQEPCDPRESDCSDDEERIGRGLRDPHDANDMRKIAGSLGGGLRLFFAEHFGLRLDVRDLVYSDRKVGGGTAENKVGDTTTDIRNNLLLFVGASFMF
jgi:outer membrane beta-barrel protein